MLGATLTASVSSSSLLPSNIQLWRPSSSSLLSRETRLWRPSFFRRSSLARAQQLDPQRQPSRDEASKLRPDINPSVLRALQGELQASSLIDNNLRKRAAARQSSGDGGHELAVSSPLADDVRDLAVAHAIRDVFWNEVPDDLALPNFLFLEFHARLYRIFVFFLLLVLGNVSPAGLLWFSLPSEALSFEPSALPSVLLLEWAKWRRSIVTDLSKVAGDSRIYMEAGQLFWEVWHDCKISDEKRICLTTALALILDIELLEALRSAGGDKGGELASVEKRLAESSAALGGAMRELQKETFDPEGVWEQALKGTSIVSDGRVFMFQQALIFPVIRDSSANGSKEEEDELPRVISQVEQRLEERYPSQVALFLRSKTQRELYYVVIAPWYWFLSANFDHMSAVKYSLFAASLLATSQFAAADPGWNSAWISWESGVVPLGWFAVLASGIMAARSMATKYRASSSLRSPFVFAFPNLGAVGRFIPFAGILPSRICLLDILLSGSYASLLASALLLAFGFAYWGPSHYDSAPTADFRGYLLVPPDLFSYSGVFTMVLNGVSVAALKGEEDGSLALATSPFALAGLLGLNFTAFSLFPIAKSDGSLILKVLLGNTIMVEYVSLALAAGMLVSFFSKNPTLGICWLAYSGFLGSASLSLKDEVSEPSLFKRIAGFVLVAAAVICFVPFPE